MMSEARLNPVEMRQLRPCACDATTRYAGDASATAPSVIGINGEFALYRRSVNRRGLWAPANDIERRYPRRVGAGH
jgi:hypothetical protein